MTVATVGLWLPNYNESRQGSLSAIIHQSVIFTITEIICGGDVMGPVTTNPWLIAVINMVIVFGVLIALGVLMSMIQVVDPTKNH